ncbi:enolase-phosphatase E1-like isoform X2 [Acropora muricata]
MENSGSMNENGEKTGEKDETTELFHNIGQKVTRKETSFPYVNDSPTSPRRDDLDDQNCINIEGDHLVEPITEPSHVAITKTPETQGSNENESKEDSNTTVQDLLLKIGSIIGATMPKENGKLEVDNKEDAVDEDEPIVVQRRTQEVSLQPEVAIDDEEMDEKDFEDTNANLLSTTDAERTPAADYHDSDVFISKESTEDESKEGGDATMESFPLKIETAIDDSSSKQNGEELIDGDQTEFIEEDAPVVVEKRPASLHVEMIVEQRFENDQGKDGNETNEPILETELEVVKKGPNVFDSDVLVEAESPGEDGNPTIESLLLNVESAIGHHQNAQQVEEGNETEAVNELAPYVIEKTPAPLHLKPLISEGEESKEKDEGKTDGNVEEPNSMNEIKEAGRILEDEFVLIEKKPCVLESEVLVEKKNPEDETNTDESMESVLVNIQSVIDCPSEERTEEKMLDIKGDALEEDTPVVVEKTPIAFHVGVVNQDDSDEKKSETSEVKEPVSETEVIVVEKESVPFESEILAEKESNDDSKEDESVTVETLLFDIDSVIDHPSSVAESASEIEHEALEDAPIVIEKKPTSLQIEQVRDRVEDASQNETDRNQMHSGDIEEVKDFRGPMSDAEIIVIEKKTAVIESELLIEQEEDQNDSATLESLLVNIESVIDATAPEQTEKKKDFVEDNVQETVPLAVNNRAIEIHHELLVVHSDERYELKPEDTEAEPVPPKSKVLAAQKEISAITVTTTRHTEITQAPKSVVTVIPAEESLKSASYSNLVSGDDKKDKTELLLQVPVRRLSAPEVLPEKENDGSAPLASSDSGLLDPLLESSPRVHDKLEKKIDQEAEIVSTDREPYRDVSEEQKLIGDTSEDVEGISQKKDSAQTPPNAEDEQELLDIVNEEKSDEDKLTKKEGKGIFSPQCKCCSLM